MRIAYLDGFSGISGDMFLGALVDAGVPFELLQQTVAALGIGTNLEISRVDRNGISAVKIDVVVGGKKDLPREEFWESEARPEHSHHEKQAPSHGRHLSAILKIIAAAPISGDAKKTASAMFRPRSTTPMSKRCIFTRSGRRMRWSILCARRWAHRRWE